MLFNMIDYKYGLLIIKWCLKDRYFIIYKLLM